MQKSKIEIEYTDHCEICYATLDSDKGCSKCGSVFRDGPDEYDFYCEDRQDSQESKHWCEECAKELVKKEKEFLDKNEDEVTTPASSQQ